MLRIVPLPHLSQGRRRNVMSRTAKTIAGMIVLIALWVMVGVGATFVALAMGALPGTREPGWEGVAIAALYMASCPIALDYFVKRGSRRAADEFDQEIRDRIATHQVTVRGVR